LYRAVLFDFDYTLADSSEGIIECANLALQTMGLPQASADEIRATIGLSLTEMFVRFAGPHRRDRAPDFQRHFAHHADRIMADRTKIYPYVPDTLAALVACELRLGILSTKFRYRIEAVLDRAELHAPFEFIVGGEDVRQHKPDPEGLKVFLTRSGLQPTELLYVGDSITDAETALRAGVAFAAVLSGVTPAEAFQHYPVETVLDNVSQLPEWLKCPACSDEPQGQAPCLVQGEEA